METHASHGHDMYGTLVAQCPRRGVLQISIDFTSLHLYFNVLPQTICNAQRNAIS